MAKESTESNVTEFPGQVTGEELAGNGVAVERRLSDDDLRGIDSFEAAMRAVTGVLGAEIVDASEELGTGFILLDSKEKGQLVGKACIFLSWNFNTSDDVTDDAGNPTEFVSAQVVVKVNNAGAIERFIVNDGSTGIYRQLRAYTDRTGRTAGLAAKRGLRRSDYKTPDGKDATTFYIDTSA